MLGMKKKKSENKRKCFAKYIAESNECFRNLVVGLVVLVRVSQMGIPQCHSAWKMIKTLFKNVEVGKLVTIT